MADIEKNTNQVFRKKYFLESDKLFKGMRAPEGSQSQTSSCILNAGTVTWNAKPVSIGKMVAGKTPDKIRIQLNRTDGKIRNIQITCPCGRHAELNCEYEEPVNVPCEKQ